MILPIFLHLGQHNSLRPSCGAPFPHTRQVFADVPNSLIRFAIIFSVLAESITEGNTCWRRVIVSTECRRPSPRKISKKTKLSSLHLKVRSARNAQRITGRTYQEHNHLHDDTCKTAGPLESLYLGERLVTSSLCGGEVNMEIAINLTMRYVHRLFLIASYA